MKFKEIKIENIKLNPFTKIGKEYILITSSTSKKYNIMTAAWGTIGVIWGKNIITIYVRPQRYTKIFLDLNSIFSISFLDKKYKNVLDVCGKICGYNKDKINITNLHVNTIIKHIPIFKESYLTFICKKIYHSSIQLKNFYTQEIYKWYKNRDYHVMYIGEIINVFKKIK